jgi:hypothetical protein
MSKLGDKLKKASHGKAVGAIKKIGNSLPISKGIKKIGSHIKSHKKNVSGDPVAQDLGGSIAGAPIKLLGEQNQTQDPAPRASTLEQIQSGLEKGLTIVNSAGEFVNKVTGEKVEAQAEGETPGRELNPNPPAPADENKVVAWLKQKWYIPVAAIVVIAGVFYFVKKRK